MDKIGKKDHLNFQEVTAFRNIYTNNSQIELKPFEASMSSINYDQVAKRCIDGSSDSPCLSSSICATTQEKAPWFAIDYGYQVSVEKVVLINRDNKNGDCPNC